MIFEVISKQKASDDNLLLSIGQEVFNCQKKKIS